MITTGGNLPAKWVIHTVGPIYGHHANAAELLASCYSSSLDLAREHRIRTIAFPSISTGVYGYPLADAAEVAISTIYKEIGERAEAFDELIIVLYSDNDFEIYHGMLATTIAQQKDDGQLN